MVKLSGVNRGAQVIMNAFGAKLKKKRMTNFEYCATTSRLFPLHDGMYVYVYVYV